jgi:purple acid phosphatase-like protein/calcineurin-like phosphoesterase family protein
MRKKMDGRKKRVILFITSFSLLFLVQMVVVDSLNLAAAAEIDTPKGIHLNISGDSRHEIAVSWYTTKNTETKVEYGVINDSIQFKDTAIYSLDVIESKTWIHHGVIQNLLPNTTYFYRVGGASSGWSLIYSFITSPDSDYQNSQSLHFMVYGDNRSNRELRRLVNRAIIQNETTYFDQPARFLLHAGDIVKRGNEHDLFNLYWDDSDAANLHNRIPMVPTQGNHEFGGLDESYYREQFVLPENGLNEWYYAMRYGSAFIAALDSEGSNHGMVPYDSQSPKWIKEAFSLSNKDPHTLWNFAFFHAPYYVSSSHMPREDLREAWAPIIDQAGVDLVFNGHCHLYERSHPVSATKELDLASDPTNTSTYTDPKYPIYIVSGAAGMGGPIDRLPERDNAYMKFQNYTWHYVDILLTNDDQNKKTTLQAKVVGILPIKVGSVYSDTNLSNTVLLDEFTITKDIPDAYYSSTDTSYTYDSILDLQNQKVLGITLTIILAVALVVVDLLIIRRKKNAEKIIGIKE